MTVERVDVLIVGAGLSGICAAYYLQSRCPTHRYVVLEARQASGGTWDLFRYPGVRSDSEMYTLGYSFRPWRNPRAIVDGPTILRYLRATAAQYGIDRQTRFGHRVRRACWSSADARWTVEVERERDSALLTFSCAFVFLCSGYYDYSTGYTPSWPDVERFAGRIVHPQHWPHDLDYANKRLVVIGSGATAVTLVPALAKHAAHVTMVQRSPSYIVALPSRDAVANRMLRHLPAWLADRLVRWRAIGLSMYFYRAARRRPDATRQQILHMARQLLGPAYDVETHFAPSYNPWDQRLCVAPDGDLFRAIAAGKVELVTDRIDGFTQTGIRLASGAELNTDIVVTATGLQLQLLGGIELLVDNAPVDLGTTLTYKGLMFSDVPNLVSVFGYTNASWTLKCELIAAYVCRLLNYMQRHGYEQCTPRRSDASLGEVPLFELSSGYVQRALDRLPRQGPKPPWRMFQNYLRDVLLLRFGRVNDGAIEFKRRSRSAAVTQRRG